MKTLAEKKFSGQYYGGLYHASTALPIVAVVVEIYDSDYRWWESSCLIFTNEIVEFTPLSAAAQEANRLKETVRDQIAEEQGIAIGYPITDGIYPLQELGAVVLKMIEKDWQ